MDTFSWAVVHVGDSFVDDCTVVMQVVVEFAFVDQLGVIWIYGLDFYSHFQVGFGIDRLVDLAECAFVNFFGDFEVFANFFNHLWHVASTKNLK